MVPAGIPQSRHLRPQLLGLRSPCERLPAGRAEGSHGWTEASNTRLACGGTGVRPASDCAPPAPAMRGPRSSTAASLPTLVAMASEQTQAPAAWYVDPQDGKQLRYFDGCSWTEHVSPAMPTVPAAADLEPAQDLAGNRPGAAARAKALEARWAAPVSTQIARVVGVHTDERAWRIGADGEEEVGRQLAKLGDAWRVLHAVPVGERGSDIDHVVIGPPGVFTLNTKNHPGKNIWVAERTFMVSGDKTDYLRNSTFEGRRATKLLSRSCGFDVPVEPVIVVMAAKLTIKARPVGVQIVGRKSLVKWLKSRPTTLTPEGVAEIYQHARSKTTWQ